MKNKFWKIKRYLIEEFEVEAPTKKEALQKNLQDPNKVTVIKETCKQAKK